MNDPKFLQLIEKLRTASSLGNIKWEETAEEDMFRARLGNGMVRIGRSFFRDEKGETQPRYVVALLTVDGTIVHDLDDSSGLEEYALLEELFRMARDRALGGEELVNSMLADLDKRK